MTRTGSLVARMGLLVMAAFVSGCGTTVHLTSSPAGADVYTLYGSAVGSTPYTTPKIGLMNPRVAYELRKEGYVPKKIMLSGDPSAVNVELEKEIPKTAVSSKPTGADVYDQDGGLVGQTPISVVLPDKAQPYEVRMATYETKTITLSQNSPKTLEINLGQPIAGMILMEVVTGEKGLEIMSRTVFADKDVIERSPSVRAVKRLTDFPTTRQVQGPYLFPDNKRLLMDVFDHEAGAEGEKPAIFCNLWAMNAALGGSMQRWTDGAYFDESPCFSSDGQFIFFSSNRAGKNSIFRMSATDVKGLGLVTTGATLDKFPQISPNGQSLMWTAFTLSTTIPQLWSLPLRNGLPTGLPMQIREGQEPRWSPDGKAILYSSLDRNIKKWKIWTMTPDGSNPTQLTTGSDCNDIHPCWSPDGSRIVFASDRGMANGKQNCDIWIMNADGSNPKQLTTNGSHDDHPIISADGKTVYFRSNRGLKWDVWVLEIADKDAQKQQ